MEELLAGHNVSLTVNGSTGESSLISRILEDVEFEVYLNTTGPLTIDLSDIFVNQVWDTGMNLSFELEVKNPAPIQGILTDLAFSIYYNGTYMSDAVLHEVELLQGTNHLNLTTEIAPDDPTPLREMIKRLFEGENVSMVVQGSGANSSSFISRILSDVNLTLNLTTSGPMSISLKDMYIEEIGENKARLSLLVEGVNPTSIHGILSNLTFDVFYEGEFLVRAELEKVLFERGNFSLRLPAVIYPSNDSALGDMIGKLINGTNATLTLKGNTEHSSSFLSKILANLSLQVNLTTNGSLNLSFNGLYINNVGKDMMNISVLIEVENPTCLKGILSNLSFDIFENDTYIGYAYLEQVSLPQGQKLLNLSTLLYIHNPEPVTGMLKKLVSGTNVTLRADGSPGNSSGFLSHIVEHLSLEIPLTTTGSVEIELKDIYIKHIAEDFIDISVQVVFTNPTDLLGILTDISFDVFYNETFLERANLTNLTLKKGQGSINYTARVRPSEPRVLIEIANSLFNGKNVSLTINGSQANSSSFLPSIMDDLDFVTTLHTTGELSVETGGLMLLESYKDHLVLGLNLTLYNPTDIRVNLDTLYFDVMDGETDVGDVVLEPFTMEPGLNYPVARMTLRGDEDTLGTIVSNHINGVDQDFGIRAAENVSDSLIGSIVEGLDQSVVLPGITESLISDVKVKVLSVSISPLA
ncbi:MAG: hypothetical protein KAU14_03440, partial [Thermoplasmata archaeon]|nr:hypothetical protein [Thermoplasmata archaeon]